MEITAGDGDGKSTFTKELARYNRSQGRKVFFIDTQNNKTYGSIPLAECFETFMAETREGTRPLFIIDGADELWYKAGGKKGKSLAELEFDKTRNTFNLYEAAELTEMKQKKDSIEWLVANRNKIDLIFSAHDESTPNARHTDYGLKALFRDRLKPHSSQVLYYPYSEEDAMVLLKHLGIVNPDLIKAIITVAGRQHKYLKALACMRVGGLRITDALRIKGDEPIPPVLQKSDERTLKSLLRVAEQRNLLG